MKQPILKQPLILCLLILLFGCSSTKETSSDKPDFLSRLETSTDSSYGYTIDNPILIGHFDHWQKNTNLALLYISRLRLNDQPLKILYRSTVTKPADQPRKRKGLPQRYGTPASLGGEWLDGFVLTPVDKSDTIRLYFDVEIYGMTLVPMGCTMAKAQ